MAFNCCEYSRQITPCIKDEVMRSLNGVSCNCTFPEAIRLDKNGKRSTTSLVSRDDSDAGLKCERAKCESAKMTMSKMRKKLQIFFAF